MKSVKIGLVGCGNVGTGVVNCLDSNRTLIDARCGMELEISVIAVRDIEKRRDACVNTDLLTTDIEMVLNHPDVDVVVELIGGCTTARSVVTKALENGKPVVTANKALLAYHGSELFALAAKQNSDIYYEAAVGGGIPIIKALREGLAPNHINRVYGILNGTCNYILTRMEHGNIDFDCALREAAEHGYAEADPSLDIDGGDTAHKTSILASLAYGEWLGMDAVFVEGIRDLALEDIRNAREQGYRIKLLGIIKHETNSIQVRVHPTLIPVSSMLAKVDDVYNAVWVSGDILGESMYYGPGAGANATASAVLADLIDVALNLKFESAHRVAAFRRHALYNTVIAMDEIRCRYYIRMAIDDRPNALATVAHIIGDAGISIASVVQKESESNSIPLIMTTHLAREADVRAALAQIRSQDIVRTAPVLLRMEDI